MGGKPRSKPVRPPPCMVCGEDTKPVKVKDSKFCSLDCAASFAVDTAIHFRWCEEHGWWNAEEYGLTGKEYAHVGCYVEYCDWI